MALKPQNSQRASNGHSPKEMVWRKNAPNSAQCDWHDIDTTILRGAVDAVTKAGGAIMFGITADGGAFSICLLQGDQKVKEYPHTAEECNETLKGMIDWYAEWKL